MEDEATVWPRPSKRIHTSIQSHVTLTSERTRLHFAYTPSAQYVDGQGGALQPVGEDSSLGIASGQQVAEHPLPLLRRSGRSAPRRFESRSFVCEESAERRRRRGGGGGGRAKRTVSVWGPPLALQQQTPPSNRRPGLPSPACISFFTTPPAPHHF
ncbi:unnamed protein product [Pleuronectes platessa]|uniref:Uncharacterized protein n=1 Tax=Pleuronectes platessa TaxID=8262 RepID=A0A9N7W5G3_PLEPL|nr:unnamed protein product [Pleuronectes platessa]